MPVFICHFMDYYIIFLIFLDFPNFFTHNNSINQEKEGIADGYYYLRGYGLRVSGMRG